tara:strand:+ start:5077 stop:6063 length:987 start_codon:yes stop_codon:yes gene_type:complete
MRLGIVILNWNGKSLLEKFLPSIIKCTPSEHNIYVIDNGSIDDSINFIEKHYRRIIIIKLEFNYGFAKGYNEGLKKINDDILCLLNNDVEVTENWTENILKQFKSESKTAVIQPKLKDFYNKEKFDYAGAAGGFLDKYGYAYCNGRIYNKVENDHSQYDKITEIFWACGACFFIRNSVFKDLGGFDEMFWAHYEEIDLCWRIQNTGYKIKYNHNSVVYHANGATLDQNNSKKTFLNYRNKLFTLTKNSKNNLFFLLLEKFFIDTIISIYILFNKGISHFTAIIRAYLSFYKHINLLIEFRKKNERKIKHYSFNSIMLKYLRLKRTKSH